MNRVAGVDELLNEAFKLAYLIIGDRMTAVRIAMAAMDNLKVASSVQKKRKSYLPTGSAASRAARTKVWLSEVHILQRLVYIESEIYERLQEQEGAVGQEDLIIHYIKHLVRVATKRNSFYVSLCLSRLLYNYATSEASEIYNLVVQDPDRMRDDYYYRSRKGRLIAEMKERFAGFVKTYRSERGEERFEASDKPDQYAGFVKECLLRFTPWFTNCVLPADIDPARNVINPLLFKGVDPDEEHSIEINRMHTLIHPDCYRRLVSALGFDPPDRRLEVPYFFISRGDSGPPDERFNPPGLTEQELNAIKNSLDSKAKRRRGKTGDLLRVYVDGIERASFEPARSTGVQLRIDDDWEVIQVRADKDEEEVLLATHLFKHGESGIIGSESTTVAEGGQRISFEVFTEGSSSDEPVDTIVRIEYRETGLIRAASLYLRQLKHRLTDNTSLKDLRQKRLLKPALIILLIIASAVALLIYWQSRQSGTEQVVMPGQRNRDSLPQLQSNTNEGPVPQPEPQPAPDNRGDEPPGGQIASGPKTGESTGGTTRGPQERTPAAVLLSVRKVYVDPLGEEGASAQARQALIARLQSSNRFVVVENRDEADAVLKGTPTRADQSSDKVSLTLRLVNVKGEVIWPLGKAAYRYTGPASGAGDGLLRDLLDDIQTLERRR